MFGSNCAEIQRAKILLGSARDPVDDTIEVNKVSAGAGIGRISLLRDLFFYSGMPVADQRKFICLTASVSFVFVLLSIWIGKPVVASLAALPLFVAVTVLKKKSRLRAEAFEKDYTAFILALASSVRTGLDPLVALVEERNLFPEASEIHRQLRALQEQIDRGASEEDAIRSFAGSIQHPDLALFRTAFILARKEGASLAECLQRLARVTRQRQSFRRKVKGAVAMQKLSSFGIAGCTVVIGVIQFTTNPEAIKVALEHPLGVKLLAGGIGLVVFGLVWMLQLAKPRI